MRIRKPYKWAIFALGVLIVVGTAQSARLGSTELNSAPGHTIQEQFAGSTGLDSVLVRACGDCHSNSVPSGWFTRVPPLSWVTARAVQEGRSAVNFAEWSAYSPEQRRALLLASCADAKNGTMPVSVYLRVRPDARLSARDIETVCGAAR